MTSPVTHFVAVTPASSGSSSSGGQRHAPAPHSATHMAPMAFRISNACTTKSGGFKSHSLQLYFAAGLQANRHRQQTTSVPTRLVFSLLKLNAAHAALRGASVAHADPKRDGRVAAEGRGNAACSLQCTSMAAALDASYGIRQVDAVLARKTQHAQRT